MKICVLRDRALATALACVRGAAQGRSVELLRKESLAGLAPAAAARVLSHAYMAVVPITPLPFPPLPLSPLRPGASGGCLVSMSKAVPRLHGHRQCDEWHCMA